MKCYILPTYIGFQTNSFFCLNKGHGTYFLFLTWPRTSVLFASMQVEEGWWEGVLNGKTGMFPSNFIKELSGESDELGISQDEQLSKSSKEVYCTEQERRPLGSALASLMYHCSVPKACDKNLWVFCCPEYPAHCDLVILSLYRYDL